MPGFGDSAFLVLLALLLFGPKKLPELARQLGKLMADFRRASNEFRTQMEEELRISEQTDRQKQIAALEAASPTPAVAASDSTPALNDEPDDPYRFQPESTHNSSLVPSLESTSDSTPEPASDSAPTAALTLIPIATSGELSIMPPSTGLPIANSSPPALIDVMPAAPAPDSLLEVRTEAGNRSTVQAEADDHANVPAHEAELETETLHG